MHNKQSNRVLDMAPYFEELVQRDTIRATLGLAEVNIAQLWWIETPDHWDITYRYNLQATNDRKDGI